MNSVFEQIDSLVEKIKARHAVENDVIVGAPKTNATDIDLVCAVELLTKQVEKMSRYRVGGLVPDLENEASLQQFLGELGEQLNNGDECCIQLPFTNANQALYYYKFGGQVFSGVYSSNSEFSDAKSEWLKKLGK